MKEVRLEELHIENFKGLGDKHFHFEGKDSIIMGTNDAGKTTIFDAFRWLLFDKDSHGNSRFAIKPLDSQNNPIHKVAPTVIGFFKIQENGETKEVKLKKRYKEQWKRPRGSNEEVLSGHTTDHYINDREVKKKEYEGFIKENIGEEEVLETITNPLHFPSLHWKEQRSLLFDMIDEPDASTIAAEHEMYDLAEVIEHETIEDFIDARKSQLREVEKELNKIDGKMEEARNNAEQSINLTSIELEEESLEQIEELIRQAELEKEDIQEELAEIKADSTSQIRKEFLDKKEEYQELKDSMIAGVKEEYNEDIEKLEEKKQSLQQELGELQNKFTGCGSDIARLEEDRERLLDEYQEWNEKEFPEEKKECPTCGREFAEEKIEQHRKEFNQEKSEKLEQITEKGQQVREKLDRKKEEHKEYKQKMQKKEGELEEVKEQLEDKRATKKMLINDLQSDNPDDEELAELVEELKELKQQMDTGTEKPERQGELEKELEKVNDRLEILREKRTEFEKVEDTRERVSEIQEEMRELAEEEEMLEKEIYKAEKLQQKRIESIQDSINEKFDVANFKLFREPMSGGRKEWCVAMKDGVPYDDLNTGSKYQVGMDILDTIAEHWGIRAPVWIDNRERLAKLQPIDSQEIHLIMTPGRKLELKEKLEEDTADNVVEKEAGPTQTQLPF